MPEDEHPDAKGASSEDVIASDLLDGDILHATSNAQAGTPAPDEVKITQGGITDATGTVPLGGSSDVGGTGDAIAAADVGATTGAGALGSSTGSSTTE